MKILKRKLNQQKTIRQYKGVAWYYNIWSKLTESKAFKLVLEQPEIKDNQNILEVACGTGLVFEQLVRKNPNGVNIGMDLSPHMLKKALQRLSPLDPSSYELQEGDVFQLNFSDDSFNVLINNFMIDLMPEEAFDAIASEFYRVINPGGVALISNFSFGGKKINRIWYWVAEKMPGLLTGCRPVLFIQNLMDAGFIIEWEVQISQNTFPSQIIKARKPLVIK